MPDKNSDHRQRFQFDVPGGLKLKNAFDGYVRLDAFKIYFDALQLAFLKAGLIYQTIRGWGQREEEEPDADFILGHCCVLHQVHKWLRSEEVRSSLLGLCGERQRVFLNEHTTTAMRFRIGGAKQLPAFEAMIRFTGAILASADEAARTCIMDAPPRWLKNAKPVLELIADMKEPIAEAKLSGWFKNFRGRACEITAKPPARYESWEFDQESAEVVDGFKHDRDNILRIMATAKNGESSVSPAKRGKGRRFDAQILQDIKRTIVAEPGVHNGKSLAQKYLQGCKQTFYANYSRELRKERFALKGKGKKAKWFPPDRLRTLRR